MMGSPLARQVDRLTHTHTGERILDLLHAHHKQTSHLPDPAKKALVLSGSDDESKLSTEMHENSEELLRKDASAKKWEDLSKTQQERWRAKLIKAGAWSADYSETIFKGVFFSELAGAVGRAAAEALQG
jgi:prolactin regulatory element-binding protein